MAANSSTTHGKPAFQTGGGLKALQYMVQTVKDGITNPNSKEFLEEDVRRVFQNGEAAFALNWTYMYNLANDPKESKVAGQVGVRPGARRRRVSASLRGQWLDGARHHRDQQAPGRGLEVRRLHDLAAGAERLRQAQPADLGLVL